MNVSVNHSGQSLASLSCASEPGLLVSVRNANEAAAALAGGASVIDVKEPMAGPLGAASLGTISSVVEAVAGVVPVTAASGELGERFAPESLPRGVAIVKLGLAGCADQPWRSQTERWASRLQAATAGALVAYADWRAAAAPAPEEVLAHAVEIGCRGFVVDTWSKAEGCSLDLLDATRLRSLVEKAKGLGLLVVLAGSIGVERLEEAAAAGPTLIGVRGAACIGGRSGEVDAGRVRELSQRLGACRGGR